MHGYLRKSAYEGEEGEEEPTVLLDSAAARLVTRKRHKVPLEV